MLTLRPYQLEAIEAIDDSEEDCVVKMFCGTGKSLVMFTYVTDRLEQFPYSVFVFPSLALITQFQDDYLKNIPNVLSVSSEPGSTTDQVIIKNFIELHEQKIICVTYQSLQTLMEVSPCPDVMMFDEAHHAVESYVSGTINDIDCKKVFLTATPPDDELGPIVYEYMHHDGVIQGKLNDFNIMIDFSTENTNETIYDSIIRAVMKTKNSRVLTFHQRVNTDENTSVKNFVNQELLLKSFEKIGKEFPGHGYTSVKFLSIDAGTLPNERKKNLTLLDGGKEHEIVILSSCKTIGEGVDTKKANMIVFVDAKNSLTDIIQNIGRIVRKQPRDSTILIPCWVDKTKYDGAEDKDAVIREDLGKQGNFNGILNVISALRQHDPELYELCLKYPKVFTKEEMKKNFEKQGVKDTGNIWTQKQVDDVSIKLPELQLEIHTHDVENPIEIVHPEATAKKVLYKDEEGKYHEMKPKNKKKQIVSPRKKLFDIHSSDEIRVDWLITEESLGSAYIDCQVTVEYDPLKRAQELVQLFKDNGRYPSQHSKDSIEKRLGKKLNVWRQALKGNGRNKIPDKVKEYLDIELPGWSDGREDITNQKLYGVVQWCNAHVGKFPSTISDDKNEKILGKFLDGRRRALKLKKLPDSEKEYLDTELPGWSDTSLEYKHLKKAQELVQLVRDKSKYPNTNSKDQKERNFAQQLTRWRRDLKNGKLLKEVREYLDSELPDWSDTIEDKSMKRNRELVQWICAHDKYPSSKSKDQIERSLGCLLVKNRKDLKNGKLSKEVKEYLDTEFTGWVSVSDSPDIEINHHKCHHVWEVVEQDDEYHYKKCKLCDRRSKQSCVAQIAGYTAPNPEKKLEINTWLSQQTFIPGKAIVLDAKDMKTCNLLPFDPSNIIVAEYDTDTFEENSKDPKFGKCLVNGDFLEVLKTVDPSEISLIYADFTGHFDKWVRPLLEYLTSITRLNSGIVLGITWSECGCKKKRDKHLKDLGKFVGANKWGEIENSPQEYEYGHGGNMHVDFLKSVR